MGLNKMFDDLIKQNAQLKDALRIHRNLSDRRIQFLRDGMWEIVNSPDGTTEDQLRQIAFDALKADTKLAG